MVCSTNRLNPTGGDTSAISTTRTTKIPNQTRSNPACLIIGTTIDVVSTIIEIPSSAVPRTMYMRAPMMLIHTVAAGGGSILHFDGARFRVGPDSAGANPGPKCYRRDGPLAVTDANVMVGKLIPDFFPKIFGPAQNLPLDANAVRNAFAGLAQQVGGRKAEEVADGFIKIAVENMERDYDYSSVRHAADLESPEKIGRTAGERALARLNPHKVSTRKVPVVFDSRSAGSLVSHLANAVNGSSVARKTSFLRDQMGTKLFADGIRIIDDPLRKRGLRSHPFDGEGVVCRKLALIEDGVLRSWLLDSATARELGLVTTGNAQRGSSSVTSPGPSNLHLEAGQLSPEDLIADIADGFYVTDLIGVGANMVTGDYSRGASGFWIQNGKRTFPVSEVTIAGHLLDMFRTLTPANDLAFRYSTNAPTLRVEGLTVAGQ